MATHLYEELKPKSEYFDKSLKLSKEDYDKKLKFSGTVYVGNKYIKVNLLKPIFSFFKGTFLFTQRKSRYMSFFPNVAASKISK